MGYIRHHAIIVTSWDETKIEAAHAHAVELLQGYELSAIVSPVLAPTVNAYKSFLIGPDGSKEGWSTSDQGDDYRASFIAWLNAQAYSDGSSPFAWALVQYGDDNDDNRVVSSDADLLESVEEPA